MSVQDGRRRHGPIVGVPSFPSTPTSTDSPTAGGCPTARRSRPHRARSQSSVSGGHGTVVTSRSSSSRGTVRVANTTCDVRHLLVGSNHEANRPRGESTEEMPAAKMSTSRAERGLDPPRLEPVVAPRRTSRSRSPHPLDLATPRRRRHRAQEVVPATSLRGFVTNSASMSSHSPTAPMINTRS